MGSWLLNSGLPQVGWVTGSNKLYALLSGAHYQRFLKGVNSRLGVEGRGKGGLFIKKGAKFLSNDTCP